MTSNLITTQSKSNARQVRDTLAGKLGIHEFMVLKSGGVPLFHYSPDGSRRLDELLSGFLSAISSFATEFGEKSVQSLSFEGSELLYEQFESDCIFVFLSATGAPKKVLRAVLKELGRKFVQKHGQQMKGGVFVEEDFLPFNGIVEKALAYYEGVMATTSNLSPFVVPKIEIKALKAATEAGFLDELHREFGNLGTNVLDTIDGKKPVYKIRDSLGLEEDEISEVIEYLAIWGVLTVSKMCPYIKDDDARFDAYLDIIGLPRKDYQLLRRAKSLCDGERYIVEVSEKLGVTSERLYDVLEKLGNEVRWNLVPVADLPHR